MPAWNEGEHPRDASGRFSRGGAGRKGAMERLSLGKAEKWLVEAAREAGLDIDGFEHEITGEFVSHVMNRHGNERAEAASGQVAIRDDDFARIPEIIEKPDYAIVGARSRGRDIVAYAKKLADGTTLYFEEALAGKRNKTLRSKTMFKHKSMASADSFTRMVSGGNGMDMSGAIVLDLGRRRQSGNPTTKESVAAANAAAPHDLPSVSPDPVKKSSGGKRFVLAKAKGGKSRLLIVGADWGRARRHGG
ncbi:MAG: hypothetical protein FWE09_00120 [Treponema sp.]|nr:hypothetical protein [Treponema sp.]